VSPIAYFAYGRNMPAVTMRSSCPGHRFLGRAELQDHRLAFRRRSVRTGTGVADIVSAPGQSVWGALYEIDDADLAALDQKEGNGQAYERRTIRVLTEGEPRDALAYAVIVPDAPHVKPSPEYLGALIEGARERGLPAAYIDLVLELGARETAPEGLRDTNDP